MEKFIGNCEPGEIHGSHVIQLNSKLRRDAHDYAAEHGGIVKGYLHGKFKRGWLVLALRPAEVLQQPGPDTNAPADVSSQDLPEMCVAVLQPENVLIGIKRHQHGYFQMYDGTVKGNAARLVADRMNRALGVTPRQREAMLIGSMMGWKCPAACPTCDLHVEAAYYIEEVSS